MEIQRRGAAAWVALAEGRQAEALALMREAADMEDATEKAAVTPGPIKPARELLGEMLLEVERPAEALEEFESDDDEGAESLPRALRRRAGGYGRTPSP